MKQVYGDLKLKPGATNAGISKIKLVPKEWLSTEIVVDFSTGLVTTAISLIAGKSFYELEFAPQSYDYDEKPKSTKSGSAIGVTISGLLNDLDYSQLQIIESYRRSELVVIATDRQRRSRLIGNAEYGMIFSFENKNSNSPNGTQKALVTLIFDAETYPPFYIV